jgi:hypothetical protein
MGPRWQVQRKEYGTNMPAPYLLVARMPPLPSSTSTDSGDSEDSSSEDGQANPFKNGSKSKPSKDIKKGDDEGSSSAPAGGAPATNTSFLASTPQYMLKLVYFT